jgi:F-type H+-transporting ATPase subunit gamma
MPNLQDIRRRVRSVKNLQKITKAMKMVSAAKLRRAQDRVVSARPYAGTMMRVLGRLAARAGDYKHPLLEVREEDKHYVVALVTSDKGLCGAFNTNLIKAAQKFMRENAGKTFEMVTIGRKGRDFFRRRVDVVNEYTDVTKLAVTHAGAAEIAHELMEKYTAEGSTVDRVFIIYNEFKSVLSQQVVIKQLLPISAEAFAGESDKEESEAQIDYLYEQPAAEILGTLLPRYVETQVFYALLESIASNHAAQMTAMDSASKNAGEVIDTLTLNMNRVRQASITREIIEVVSGAQSLNG